MKIIKRNILDSFVEKTFPDRNRKYLGYDHHYNQMKNKCNELLEKFNNFLYDFFRVENYNSNFNLKEFPGTSSILNVIKEGINDIGNQLFISFESIIAGREYLKEIDKSNKQNGLEDDTFNYYFNRMMDVKFFNLDYFISQIFYFCNMMCVTIPKSSDPVENINIIRTDVLNCIIKSEEKLKSNEKYIMTVVDKIREHAFDGQSSKYIAQEKPIEFGSRDHCIERFEKSILRDNIQICMTIKNISEYILSNFNAINYHVVSQINDFFNGMLDVLMDDFICGAYILQYHENTKEEQVG